MSGNQVWVSEASNVDGVSGETILGMLAAGNSTEQFGIMEMFIGNIPGSIAETSTLMVLIGAFILIYTGLEAGELWLVEFLVLQLQVYYLIYGCKCINEL